MNSFYTQEELALLGLKSFGNNVLISKKCSIFTPEKVSIGNNVRIDDFCILSGTIKLGDFVHISAYSALYGSQGITFCNHTGCSARTTIYSAMDDFSGEYLIGPMHPEHLTCIKGGEVVVSEFVQIGANCVVFPNLIIGEGAVIGAMSLVRESVRPWTVNVGIPLRVVKIRNNNCKKLLENE